MLTIAPVDKPVSVVSFEAGAGASLLGDTFFVENLFKSTRSVACIPPVPVMVWAIGAAADATSA